MGLGSRLALLVSVGIAGFLGALWDTDVLEVLAGTVAVALAGGVVIAWVRVLRSGKEIARRYLDEQLHPPLVNRRNGDE